MNNPYHAKGFTVLELLIVIAIIGVLSTIILVALGGSREKATNAKIVAQLSSMRTQSELFYAKHQNYGTPVTTGWDCSSATLFDGTDPDGLGALIAGTPDGYHVSCYATPDPYGDPTVAAKWAVFVSPDGSGIRWCTDETHQVVSDEDISLINPGSCYLPRFPS